MWNTILNIVNLKKLLKTILNDTNIILKNSQLPNCYLACYSVSVTLPPALLESQYSITIMSPLFGS